MQGAGPSQFAQTLKAASTSSSLYLYVVASPVHDRESTAQPERDAIMFACEMTGIRAILKHFGVGALSGADQLSDFPALAERLVSVDGYHWLDVYVGTHVPKGDHDLDKLYKDTLSYFDHWTIPAQMP